MYVLVCYVSFSTRVYACAYDGLCVMYRCVLSVLVCVYDEHAGVCVYICFKASWVSELLSFWVKEV